MKVRLELEIDVENSEIGVEKEIYYSIIRMCKDAHQDAVNSLENNIAKATNIDHINMLKEYIEEHQKWANSLRTCKFKVIE